MIDFYNPTHLIFGAGSIREIPKLLHEYRRSKVFVVCDQGVEKVGIVAKVLEQIEAAGATYNVFNGVEPNPTVDIVNKAAEQGIAYGPDCTIAIGGGSSMDTAKAVNVLFTNPGPITQYEGVNMVPNHTHLLIVIPTTSGTASEVTNVSVVTDTVRKKKMVIAGQHVPAGIALCDPELTLGLPASITAATGMDALTHAMEAYMSRWAHIPSDINALKSMELIFKNLATCVKDGKNIEARSNQMLGSTIAGFAFNSSNLGLAHAIAHPLGAYFNIAHGVANAIALPTVIAFNGVAVPQRVADMGAAIGLPKDQQTVEGVAKAVQDLAEEIKIPKLADVGVTEKDFDVLVPAVMQEPSIAMKINPRDVTEAEVRELLYKL